MNHVIAFTPGQILALCSAIVVVSGVVNLILGLISKASAPNKVQNARLDAIETRLDRHDELFRNDLKRFEDLEGGNRVTQRALLALLSHGIDGNDIESMRKAKKDLEEYLIGR